MVSCLTKIGLICVFSQKTNLFPRDNKPFPRNNVNDRQVNPEYDVYKKDTLHIGKVPLYSMNRTLPYLYFDGETPKYFLNAVLKYLALS